MSMDRNIKRRRPEQRIAYIYVGLCAALLGGCTSSPSPPPQAPETVWTLIEKGEVQRVEEFFTGKLNINTTDEKGRTPLIRAVELQDTKLTALFLALGAAVELQDTEGRTALEIACSNGNQEITKLLAARGAPLYLASTEAQQPVRIAIQKGEGLLAALIHPATLSQRDEKGRTLLHLAALMGKGEAVQQLLAAGIPLNIKDGNGKTALDYTLEQADSYEHVKCAEPIILAGGVTQYPNFSYLLQTLRSYNVSIRFADGSTPLHQAARAGHRGVIQYLLEKKADINAKDSAGSTALHDAARAGHLVIVKTLLEQGADPNARDAKGNTVLHLILPSQVREEAVKTLLSYGANPNSKDEHGDAPLHIAIAMNLGEAVVAQLLAAGADINIRNTKGQTPLHMAVIKEAERYVPLCLEKQADLFATDIEGESPLSLAFKMNSRLIPLLITPQTVQLTDNMGNSPLHLAVSLNAPLTVIEHILKVGGNVNARNKTGSTPLFIAIEKNNREVGELLLSRGADIFTPDASGKSPLYIACTSPGGLREWMINSYTITATDNLGNGILHYLAQWKLASLIPVVAQRGAPIDKANATGESPLFFAVKANHPASIQALATAGANLQFRDRLGNTALHIAVRWNSLEAAQFLIEQRLPINAQNAAGKSALHVACTLGMHQMTDLLIQQGADLNIPETEGNTPLMDAIGANNAQGAERLLNAGADPQARNNRGDTPLHMAVILENTRIANILLSRGASIHARNSIGKSALQMALTGSYKMVPVLLTKDRINSTDDDGNGPLHTAILEGSPLSVIKQIVELGTRIHTIDARGKTALRLAIDREAWDVASFLIEQGASPFSVAADGESPASVALSQGTVALGALFSGSAIQLSDSTGNTILHYAASKGNEQAVRFLLSLGASKTARNTAGETPYDVALRWGRKDLAPLLQ
ncbi:ankyrin repeat domain-containing protein [Treponema sp. J25]|uniref:ankyrin repeat domain-containing protein n=1 Tax=Treponema sp. J25 TaxID=2094121 RepID=UPI001052FD8B|nr:ankyrin repeat domain-containing protein [Treponema sp. J25]TCW61989.1 hypothetical protein C5O22_03490 [Treponema sp. J25]